MRGGGRGELKKRGAARNFGALRAPKSSAARQRLKACFQPLARCARAGGAGLRAAPPKLPFFAAKIKAAPL
ncbi:MAG: hypothetical protein DBY09_04645 [Selenomonadales bacterium]|nr:MAG: hypothetical protein DBY09_04645 [Selenomonadales bacterium]